VEINLKGFLSHGTEFRVVFSSAEGFGTEFRNFLFHGTTGIPLEIAVCSVYSVFRGIIFLSEIPNPSIGPLSVYLSFVSDEIRACTPTLSRLGLFFYHDGIYARKWPLPLYAYFVGSFAEKMS
jgi:hypothetical protein